MNIKKILNSKIAKGLIALLIVELAFYIITKGELNHFKWEDWQRISYSITALLIIIGSMNK